MTEQLLGSPPPAPIPVFDWRELAARHWNRSPVRLRGHHDRQALPEHRLFAVTATASQPFRAGMRTASPTDVRFFVPGARIAAPGDLLPTPVDQSFAGYHRRLAAGFAAGAEPGYLLRVVQPLQLDFLLWSWVRELVRGLWELVGFPVLPLVAELVLSDRLTDRAAPATATTHATLLFLLWGTAKVWLGGQPAGATDQVALEAGAGDLLYLPAGCWPRVRYDGPCLALRLLVPVAGRLPVAAALAQLADLAHSRRDGDDRPPYLPHPAPVGGPIPQLASAAAQFQELSSGPALVRLLRLRWAARVSAHGLEPVPPPRPARSLGTDDRVRLGAEVVRLGDGPDREVWAVNGHLVGVRGAPAGELHRLLRTGEAGVDQLCRALSGDLTGGAATQASALLQRLYALRGLELVAEREV